MLAKKPRHLAEEVLYYPGFEIDTFDELYAQKIAQETIYEEHRAAFYHIFRFKGKGNYHYIKNKKVTLENDSLLIINRDILQRYSHHRCTGDVILFSYDFLGYDQEKNEFLNTCTLFQADYALIPLHSENFIASMDLYFSSLKSMVPFNKNETPEIRITILRNHLHNMLITIEREYRLRKKNVFGTFWVEESHIQQFKDLLNTHYQTQKRVAFYAKQINITEKKLSQIIYNTHGFSAKEYINEKILMEAIRLLENTTLNQEEIANELGFDFTYFIKFFRKYKGMPPAQYRREKNKVK